MRISFTIACLFSLFQPFSAHAQSDALVEASKDNTLYEDNTGGTSNGAGFYIFAGQTNTGAIRRAVLAFDVAGAIPNEASVDSVQLVLNMSKTAGGANTVTLHRIVADWGEGTSKAFGSEGQGIAATPEDATWLHRNHDHTMWQNAGGDFESRASAGTIVNQVGIYTWYSTPEMVADVRKWIETPEENFGWLLLGNEESLLTAKRFDSRQNPNTAVRPRLRIFHSVATATESIDVPASVRLQKNYPNPFHQRTTIVYELERAQPVTLDVYDLTGRTVASFIESWQTAGYHEIVFDAASLPAGLYVYRISTTDVSRVGSMIIIR